MRMRMKIKPNLLQRSEPKENGGKGKASKKKKGGVKGRKEKNQVKHAKKFDLTLKNKKGKTALMMADEKGMDDFIEQMKAKIKGKKKDKTKIKIKVKDKDKVLLA